MQRVRCALHASGALRGHVSSRAFAMGSTRRQLSATAVPLSTKQDMKSFTVKEPRPSRPRVARDKRRAFLATRKAAYQAEQEKAAKLRLDWNIKSALILERLPVIMEDFADWQRDFWHLQSVQASYGPKFPAEMGFTNDDEGPLTFEEILERSPVPLAPRRTEEDARNDRTSLNRALDQRLVLIVKPGPQAAWQLPESAWEVGETIRQAAERNARQLLTKMATRKGQPDNVAQLHFVGNCPAGWFWRTADESQWAERGSFGDKVFLNKAQLIAGKPTFSRGRAAEYLWVTKHEIADYIEEDLAVYLKHVL